MSYFKKLLLSFVFIGFSSAHAGSYEDFFKAIESDNPQVITELLQRGFDPNTVNPEGQYALGLAVRLGSLKVVQVLLSAPDIKVETRTAQDESALMFAALKGYLDVCKALIARDADVYKPGWAPLHYAAANGHVDVINLLLEHYAYPDAESPNMTTPLMMAALYGNPESVKALLDGGADPTLKNSLGLTALNFAQQGGQAESVELIAAALRGIRPKGTW
jgi:ankyrin repeat protein